MRTESIFENAIIFGSEIPIIIRLKGYFVNFQQLAREDSAVFFKKINIEQLNSLIEHCSYSHRGDDNDRFFLIEKNIFNKCKYINEQKENKISAALKILSNKNYVEKITLVRKLLSEFQKREDRISFRYEANIRNLKNYLGTVDRMKKYREIMLNRDNLEYNKINLESLGYDIFKYFQYQLLLDISYDIHNNSKEIESAFLLSGNIISNTELSHYLNRYFKYAIESNIDFFEIKNYPQEATYIEGTQAIMLLNITSQERAKVFQKIIQDISDFKNTLL